MVIIIIIIIIIIVIIIIIIISLGSMCSAYQCFGQYPWWLGF